MHWPWRDLLFLHGHVVDHTLTGADAERPEDDPIATEEREPMTTARLRRSGLAALRLCLGIGDGALRTQ